MIAVQEHHIVGQDECKEAASWCLRHGWKGLFSPAAPGKGEGSSGGVALLCRSFLGFHDLPNGSVLHPSRAIGGLVHLPGSSHHPVFVASVYLYHSEGLTSRNVEIMSAVGASIRLNL